MSGMTPGQAAYERSHTAHRRLMAVTWDRLDKFDRMYWDMIAASAVAAETEACAQLCEDASDDYTVAWDESGDEIARERAKVAQALAEQIRARVPPTL